MGLLGLVWLLSCLLCFGSLSICTRLLAAAFLLVYALSLCRGRLLSEVDETIPIGLGDKGAPFVKELHMLYICEPNSIHRFWILCHPRQINSLFTLNDRNTTNFSPVIREPFHVESIIVFSINSKEMEGLDSWNCFAHVTRLV